VRYWTKGNTLFIMQNIVIRVQIEPMASCNV
jgi:hypothetical protein